METPKSPASSGSRAQSRKRQNSNVRKEQNRIASRAYREKRRQKLALLDEILKSDSKSDTTSSVSDETELNSTTSVRDHLAAESVGGFRYPSSTNSPTPYYMSHIPAPSEVPFPPFDRPNYDAVPYSVEDNTSQEAGSFATQQTGHLSVPYLFTTGMSPDYMYPQATETPMMSKPTLTFDRQLIGDSYNEPNPADSIMPAFPAPLHYDSNMINALQSLSRLNDTQQQQIVAYIQKKKSRIQPSATASPPHFGFGGYGVCIPQPRTLPGEGLFDVTQQSHQYTE
ncbi:hypothetical protein F4808DRAFT_430452 [Astrocystis sublimbata]|nr:hypothetical protein F4808DRAFT_430452 [Astrocystis sublimbata]